MNAITVALLALALAGCVTPFRSPADVAHIKLSVAGSPNVEVDKIWLERKKDGVLAVTGYVSKTTLNVVDTTGTHLDVTLFDSAGRVMRSRVAHFEPRQITKRHLRSPAYSTYRVPLDPLPAGVARIEVRTHEGNHATANNSLP